MWDTTAATFSMTPGWLMLHVIKHGGLGDDMQEPPRRRIAFAS